ncbi:MAG: hypothetical protein RSG77_05450 [Hafnia sp.]|uniref:hypothetical protein n=1 Tax=Hafnia sp. TaxID=1873498 RepID=UPI002FCAB200
MDNLIAELDVKARLAGFAPFTHIPTPPDQLLAYWESDYACIGLWKTDCTDVQAFEISRINAEKLLDKYAREREMNGVVIDASIVLALPETHSLPSSIIRQAELDTRLVRKHVVWAVENIWQRTGRVTLLGLPEVIRPTTADNTDMYSSLTQEFLAEFEGTTPAALAKLHANQMENGYE